MRLFQWMIFLFSIGVLALNGLLWRSERNAGGNYWVLTAQYDEYAVTAPRHTVRYANGQAFAEIPVRGTFLGWTRDGNWLFIQSQNALYIANTHGSITRKLFNVKANATFINPTQIYPVPHQAAYVVRTPISKTHSALYLVRGLQATEMTRSGGFVIDQLYWTEDGTGVYLVGEGQTHRLTLQTPYLLQPTSATPTDFAISLMSYAPHRIPYAENRAILEFNDEQHLRYEWSDGGLIYQSPFRANRGLVRLSPDGVSLWLGYWNLQTMNTVREVIRIGLRDGTVEKIGQTGMELKGVSPTLYRPPYHPVGLLGLGMMLLLGLGLRLPQTLLAARDNLPPITSNEGISG